ncbi:hypothetical protein NECAME_12502 [Necator americanus]|uniref:Uncharacterized protein n=1 Tax=Necator americanus TaxID=51031 RepID=W2T176_NECAM|nr:hypothetical protein NECAME_12502 [Necator americanus]ETN75294.1 hypothetical protein NECAME_12502 [Necator americanus]
MHPATAQIQQFFLPRIGSTYENDFTMRLQGDPTASHLESNSFNNLLMLESFAQSLSPRNPIMEAAVQSQPMMNVPYPSRNRYGRPYISGRPLLTCDRQKIVQLFENGTKIPAWSKRGPAGPRPARAQVMHRTMTPSYVDIYERSGCCSASKNVVKSSSSRDKTDTVANKMMFFFGWLKTPQCALKDNDKIVVVATFGTMMQKPTTSLYHGTHNTSRMPDNETSIIGRSSKDSSEVIETERAIVNAASRPKNSTKLWVQFRAEKIIGITWMSMASSASK